MLRLSSTFPPPTTACFTATSIDLCASAIQPPTNSHLRQSSSANSIFWPISQVLMDSIPSVSIIPSSFYLFSMVFVLWETESLFLRAVVGLWYYIFGLNMNPLTFSFQYEAHHDSIEFLPTYNQYIEICNPWTVHSLVSNQSYLLISLSLIQLHLLVGKANAQAIRFVIVLVS